MVSYRLTSAATSFQSISLATFFQLTSLAASPLVSLFKVSSRLLGKAILSQLVSFIMAFWLALV